MSDLQDLQTKANNAIQKIRKCSVARSHLVDALRDPTTVRLEFIADSVNIGLENFEESARQAILPILITQAEIMIKAAWEEIRVYSTEATELLANYVPGSIKQTLEENKKAVAEDDELDRRIKELTRNGVKECK